MCYNTLYLLVFVSTIVAKIAKIALKNGKRERDLSSEVIFHRKQIAVPSFAERVGR